MTEARECRKCGVKKPLDEFYQGRGDARDSVCKECRCKEIRETARRRKMKAQSEKKSADPKAQQSSEPCSAEKCNNMFAIMIDFSEFPGVLDSLEQQARSEIRSVEGQALWILKGAMDLRSVRRSIALESSN